MAMVGLGSLRVARFPPRVEFAEMFVGVEDEPAKGRGAECGPTGCGEAADGGFELFHFVAGVGDGQLILDDQFRAGEHYVAVGAVKELRLWRLWGWRR